jgi:hypothetical protein
MAGESDVAKLACFLGGQRRSHGAALGKDAIGIVETNNFMMLHQIDVVGLQSFQAGMDLAFSGFLGGPSIFVMRKTFCR